MSEIKDVNEEPREDEPVAMDEEVARVISECYFCVRYLLSHSLGRR